MKHITNCIIIVIGDNVYNVKHTNCYRWWFVGGCVTGLTLAISWYKLPVELRGQLKKKLQISCHSFSLLPSNLLLQTKGIFTQVIPQ